MSKEFAHVPPEHEIDIELSACFRERMRALFRKVQRPLWPLTNTFGKRVAVAVAILLMLLSTACSIRVVREAVADFFVSVYERFCTVESASYETSENTAVLPPLWEHAPAGFEETGRFENAWKQTVKYGNADGMTIKLERKVTIDESCFDTERGKRFTESVNGTEVLFFVYGEGRMQNGFAIFQIGDFYYSLDWKGEIELEILRQFIAAFPE